MAKGNDIDLEVISMKKWKCEKKRVNKRKTKIIMGDKSIIGYTIWSDPANSTQEYIQGAVFLLVLYSNFIIEVINRKMSSVFENVLK